MTDVMGANWTKQSWDLPRSDVELVADFGPEWWDVLSRLDCWVGVPDDVLALVPVEQRFELPRGNVMKHLKGSAGDHDQQSHGSWARGRTLDKHGLYGAMGKQVLSSANGSFVWSADGGWIRASEWGSERDTLMYKGDAVAPIIKSQTAVAIAKTAYDRLGGWNAAADELTTVELDGRQVSMDEALIHAVLGTRRIRDDQGAFADPMRMIMDADTTGLVGEDELIVRPRGNRVDADALIGTPFRAAADLMDLPVVYDTQSVGRGPYEYAILGVVAPIVSREGDMTLIDPRGDMGLLLIRNDGVVVRATTAIAGPPQGIRTYEGRPSLSRVVLVDGKVIGRTRVLDNDLSWRYARTPDGSHLGASMVAGRQTPRLARAADGSAGVRGLIRADVVSTVASAWAESSNKSPMSAAIQDAVVQEFGVGGRRYTPDMGSTKPYEAKNGGLRAVARAMYDNTQSMLKASGISAVDVYRGMNRYTPVTARALQDSTVMRGYAAMNPLSSWSTSYGVAQDFGGVIGVMRVPAEGVFCTAMTGMGCANEQEVILLGGPNNYQLLVEGKMPTERPRKSTWMYSDAFRVIDDAFLGLRGAYVDPIDAPRAARVVVDAFEALPEGSTTVDDVMADIRKRRVEAGLADD